MSEANRADGAPLPTRLVAFYEDLSFARRAALARVGDLFSAGVEHAHPRGETRGLAALGLAFDRLPTAPTLAFRSFQVIGDGANFTLTYEAHAKGVVAQLASVFTVEDGKVARVVDYGDLAALGPLATSPDAAEASPSALEKLRWPMPFTLESCDASLVGKSTHELKVAWDYAAPPEVVHRTFLGFMGDEHWSPGFLHLGWHTPEGELAGAVMDEFYWFMAMQVRIIDHTPGRRSVLRVERWSLPLATRMVQVLETKPAANGGTNLTMHIAYDVPRVFRPLHPPVVGIFRSWFMASLRGLDRMLQKSSGA